MKSTLKRQSAALMFAAAMMTTAGAARGAMDGDLRAGFVTEADAVALGGGVLMDMDNAARWYFNPNLEAAFADEDAQLSLNGDFHYDFANEPSAAFYAGGGPAVLLGDNQDSFGLNLLGGVSGRRGDIRPFGQLKGTIAEESGIAIMGGIRF